MILLRKAARSIWRHKKSYIACVALMAIGILVYVSFNLLSASLDASVDAFYAELRFADGFAKLTAIPFGEAAALGDIEGIERVEAAINADVRVQMPDSEKVITLRLISYDPEDDGRLDDFLLRTGSEPAADEVLIGEPFANAHGLQAGDELELVYGGRSIRVRIAGTVLSADYIYAIKDATQLFPDTEAFGYGYMPVGQLGRLTGRSAQADSLAFRLAAQTDWDDVKTRLEDELAPYGLLGLYPAEDQPSNAMLQTELDSVEAMATSLPMVFILMAVIILYIMLKRVIEQERGQIGILKAFGLSNAEIVFHYLGYGVITGAAGGLLGVLTGYMAANGFAGMYLLYFNLPSLEVRFNPVFSFSGLLIALASGALGALMGTRSILKLLPSEAMRPPAPPAVGRDWMSKLPFLRRLLTSHGFMAVRSITRSKFRSAFVLCGMAFSFSIMAFMSSYVYMFDALLLDQFNKVQLYDLKVTLEGNRSYTGAVEAAYRLDDGVRRAEGMLELPAELSLRHRRESTVLVGLQSGSELYKIYDSEEHVTFDAPRGGVLLSSSLANSLGARRGDMLTLNAPSADAEDLPLPVLGVVNESMGSAAYIEMESLWELLGAAPTVSSVLLAAADVSPVKEALRDNEGIAALADQMETKAAYEELIETYISLIYFMTLAGVAIAYAIITNTSSISLSERKREYATLRVMGMQSGEVSRILSFEYWILLVLGILPGIPLTRWIKVALSGVMENDLFSIPLYTPPECFVIAALGCAAAVAVSNYSAKRRIATFDMVDVLKERE